MQVPKLRFKEFTNEWETKKIHDICDIVGGGTPSKNVEQYWNGNIAWISSSDIKENDIFNINITRYINEYAIKKSATKLCPKGTINIVSRVGVGKVAISPINLCTSQDFVNLINLTCNNIFLAYNLSIIMMEKSNQTQGTSIKGITIDEIKNITINLPSLEEQTKVANFLSLIDKKIELQTQLVDNLNLYKKGLLQKVFSNNTGWETTKLGDCLNLITNGISNNQVDYITDYPVTRIETISSGYIDYSKVGYINYSKNINEFKLSKGDILFSNINSVKHIGKVAFFNSDLNLYHGMNLLRICANKKLNSKFLYYLLNTYDMKKYFTINCKQAVNQASLSIEDICRCIIKIPSIEEQNRIAELFTSLDKKIDFETEKLENLKTYKKGLLQKMFI